MRVHCVDVTSRELIYAWLFEIEADKPLVKRVETINVVAGKHTPKIFTFTNPLDEFVMLEFVSSKPSLMEVRREKQGFDAHQSLPIELFIPPMAKAGVVEEVILYVND